eukprot:CAMPEP_0173194866 /NCGR_PEP_ID=MMETSP1141-20130122/14741_1 /TAXON_ID=483371 /ORGANISM="non described non described, Strain CCMP2298" /LENGTH=62 /DNA_ID=CAMNT_0014119339 /DNA_START=344 /DNA_END=532 /DNA_ORIENTATION=-
MPIRETMTEVRAYLRRLGTALASSTRRREMRRQRRVQFQVQKEFNRANKTPTPLNAKPEVQM